MTLAVRIQLQAKEAVITSKVDLSSRRGRGQIVDGETGKILSAKQIEPNTSLIQLIVQAEFWRQKLRDNPSKSLEAVLKPYGLKTEYVRRQLQAAYLAPEIKTRIFQGDHPRGLQVQDLLKELPLSWKGQAEKFGFSML